MKNQYHIDTTPEEDALFRDATKRPTNTNKTFLKVLAVVVSAHVVIAGIVSCQTLKEPTLPVDTTKADPNNIIPSDKEFLKEVQKDVQQPLAAVQHDTKPVPVPTTKSVSNTDKLTKEYVIKKGDTVYSISKKYKLNVSKLIQINNIKDPNLIVVGQKLKFL
jgi:LysM repeat protein